MKNFNEKIQLTANWIVIFAAVVVVGIGVQRFFSPAQPIPQQQLVQQQQPNLPQQQFKIEPTVGENFSLPDLELAKDSKTLVMVLQTGCHFCTESLPFYKRVAESLKDNNIKIVAVFPSEIKDGEEYLAKAGIKNVDVKQATLSNINVAGTPTLMLLDKDGKITNYWVGKLSPVKEEEVIYKISS